jgi:aminoglycoside 6'-N-acetyltransferase
VDPTEGMIELRRLTRADLPRLGSWLAAPHVERWWREPHDPASLEARYGPAIDGPDQTALFVVLLDGEEIGFAQSYRIAADPEWAAVIAAAGGPIAAAGMDYLLGRPELLGRGLGPRLLVQLAEAALAEYPEVGWVVVDVAQANRRSWRALEKAGFHRTFAGTLSSADPSDQGPAYLYLLARPTR